jgi:hypothetical protein
MSRAVKREVKKKKQQKFVSMLQCSLGHRYNVASAIAIVAGHRVTVPCVAAHRNCQPL